MWVCVCECPWSEHNGAVDCIIYGSIVNVFLIFMCVFDDDVSTANRRSELHIHMAHSMGNSLLHNSSIIPIYIYLVLCGIHIYFSWQNIQHWNWHDWLDWLYTTYVMLSWTNAFAAIQLFQSLAFTNARCEWFWLSHSIAVNLEYNAHTHTHTATPSYESFSYQSM